jgi:signal transduction histidine kinase
MVRWRHPFGVWTWGSTALVVVVLASPLLVLTFALSARAESVSWIATASGLLASAVVLVCASFLYLHWRLTGAASIAWLTAGMAVVGIHGVTTSGLQLAQGRLVDSSAYAVASELGVALLVLLVAQRAGRVGFTGDPAAIGLLGGLALAGVHTAVATAPISTADLRTGWAPWAATLALPLVGLLVGRRLSHLPEVPEWAAVRLALAVLALFMSRALPGPPPMRDPAHVVETLLAFAGAVTLCVTCLALLRSAIADDRRSIAHLQAQLRELETATRADRERLHEVRGAIAGIASASELIGRVDPRGDQRSELEQMVALEAARLNRLLHTDTPSGPAVVALDDVIRPLVIAHRARGHDVRWSASGHRVLAVSDHLTEALNILLDNAASHGAPGTTRIEVSEVDDHVVVRVVDEGPGVPRELVGTLYEWGTRGATSRGHGIGLHVAQRLLAQGGHRLRLDQGYDGGAAFLLDLGPRPEARSR